MNVKVHEGRQVRNEMAQLLKVFCFALLIAGVRLEATISEVDLQKLNSQAESVLFKIDNALTQLENGIEEFKQDTWSKVDYYRFEADKLVDKVRDYIEYSSDKLESELSRLLHRNVSETTCNLVGQFRDQAVVVFDNLRSCVSETIDKGISRIRSISDAGSRTRMSLQNSRKRVISCTKDVTNVTAALLCLSKAGDGATVIIETVPKVLLDFVDVGVLITTFPQKLQFCAVEGSLELIRNHYIGVITQFPVCLMAKISHVVASFWSQIAEGIEVTYRMLAEKYTGNELPGIDDVIKTILSSGQEDLNLDPFIVDTILGSNHKSEEPANESNNPLRILDVIVMEIVFALIKLGQR